jgi:Calpain family cysteine protease
LKPIFERIETAYSAELITVADPLDITIGESKNFNLATALAALTENTSSISRLIED